MAFNVYARAAITKYTDTVIAISTTAFRLIAQNILYISAILCWHYILNILCLRYVVTLNLKVVLLFKPHWITVHSIRATRTRFDTYCRAQIFNVTVSWTVGRERIAEWNRNVTLCFLSYEVCCAFAFYILLSGCPCVHLWSCTEKLLTQYITNSLWEFH